MKLLLQLDNLSRPLIIYISPKLDKNLENEDPLIKKTSERARAEVAQLAADRQIENDNIKIVSNVKQAVFSLDQELGLYKDISQGIDFMSDNVDRDNFRTIQSASFSDIVEHIFIYSIFLSG